MIYLWNEQQRAANLARHRLDFRDAHLVFEAAHAWKFHGESWQRVVAYVCRGVAVMARAVLSPTGDTLTILEFRLAYRWEVNIANGILLAGMEAAGIPLDPDAYTRETPNTEAPYSNWEQFNQWAWFPWQRLAAEKAGAEEAAICKGARRRLAISPPAETTRAVVKRKLGRPTKAAGDRAAQFSLRVPRSVLKYWQHAGKGWQTRMAHRLAALDCKSLPTSAPNLPLLAPIKRTRGQVELGDYKTPICLRLPPDVLARWKATGPGWQTRMVERLARAAGDNS